MRGEDSSKFKGQLARPPKGSSGGSRRLSELFSNTIYFSQDKGA